MTTDCRRRGNHHLLESKVPLPGPPNWTEREGVESLIARDNFNVGVSEQRVGVAAWRRQSSPPL